LNLLSRLKYLLPFAITMFSVTALAEPWGDSIEGEISCKTRSQGSHGCGQLEGIKFDVQRRWGLNGAFEAGLGLARKRGAVGKHYSYRYDQETDELHLEADFRLIFGRQTYPRFILGRQNSDLWFLSQHPLALGLRYWNHRADQLMLTWQEFVSESPWSFKMFWGNGDPWAISGPRDGTVELAASYRGALFQWILKGGVNRNSVESCAGCRQNEWSRVGGVYRRGQLAMKNHRDIEGLAGLELLLAIQHLTRVEGTLIEAPASEWNFLFDLRWPILAAYYFSAQFEGTQISSEGQLIEVCEATHDRDGCAEGTFTDRISGLGAVLGFGIFNLRHIKADLGIRFDRSSATLKRGRIEAMPAKEEHSFYMSIGAST
jgi:hypothetical protein